METGENMNKRTALGVECSGRIKASNLEEAKRTYQTLGTEIVETRVIRKASFGSPGEYVIWYRVKSTQKWIIIGDSGGPEVKRKFNSEAEAKMWLDSWAEEWEASGSNQDPRDFYSIELDTDRDGVPDSTDCDPNDPTKQDFGLPTKPKPQLLGGYPVDSYYYTGTEYKLQPGAKQDKSWLKRERR